MTNPFIDSNELVLRIYSELRWKLKIRDYNHEETISLIDGAITQCRHDVPDVVVRAKAIEGFELMRSKVQIPERN
jgi:hypothetical protein